MRAVKIIQKAIQRWIYRQYAIISHYIPINPLNPHKSSHVSQCFAIQKKTRLDPTWPTWSTAIVQGTSRDAGPCVCLGHVVFGTHQLHLRCEAVIITGNTGDVKPESGDLRSFKHKIYHLVI